MVRFLVRTLLTILSNALGLLVASVLLDGFSINGVSFVAAVLVFSVSIIVLGPLITKIALTDAPALMGGVALVTTLVGLIITDVFSDGLSISGVSTWVLATLIVWMFSLIATLLLPLIFFKKVLSDKKETKNT